MEYEASEDSAVLSFSAKFPRCPMAADALEIRYRCVEDCEDDREERVVLTKCTSLSVWLESAQLEVRQRMRLIAEFSELQPFSESRVFRPREGLDAVGVVHQLADAAPGPGRSELGRGGVQEARDLHLQEDVGHATVLCEMVWKVVLCPLGNEVCEETTTKVVVEPGYHYTLSIYSYLMVSAGKVVVSVSTMDVDAVPEFSVSAVPGDYFIQLTLGGAKYPLWGSCLCGGGERGGGLAVAGDVQGVRRACERECEHAHGSGDSGGAGVGVRACEREGEEAGAAVVHGEGGVDAGAESVGRGAGGGGGLAVPGAEGAVRVGVPRDVRGLVWLG